MPRSWTRVKQRVEVGERAEHRVDVLVVADVVAGVVLRRAGRPATARSRRRRAPRRSPGAPRCRGGRRSRRRPSRRSCAGRSGRRRRSSTRARGAPWPRSMRVGSGRAPLDDAERVELLRPVAAPAIAASRRSAPRAPLWRSGWRTVVRPRSSAISMSSKPITATSSGTRRSSARAASSTPTACVSDAAKTAVGRSSRRSSAIGERARLLAAVAPARLELGTRPTPACCSARRRPRAAVLARREAERVVGPVADEADPPVAARQQVLGRELAAAHVVDDDVGELAGGRCRPCTTGRRVALERLDLVVEQRQRDDEQAVDAVEAGEVAKAPARCSGVSTSKSISAVAVLAGALGDAAQPLDDRRRREERRDDADRLRAPERQAARRRARPVAAARRSPRARGRASRLRTTGMSLSTRETVATLTPACARDVPDGRGRATACSVPDRPPQSSLTAAR